MKERSVCFTGHRDIEAWRKFEIKEKLFEVIKSLIYKGYTDFYAGGAYGFDMMAALEVLRVKELNNNVKLHIILPYKKNVNNYCSYDKYTQNLILERADDVECLFERYITGCFHTRNRKMVDSSSVCVAFLEKSSGGTYFTVNYAREKGLEIIFI